MSQSKADLEFEIVIDFAPGSGDLTSMFRTMSGLIESIQNIGRHLIGSIDTSLRPELVLEDIGKGSLKAKFKSIDEGVPDEALKDGDFKKVVGHFLLKGKKAILNQAVMRPLLEAVQDGTKTTRTRPVHSH